MITATERCHGGTKSGRKERDYALWLRDQIFHDRGCPIIAIDVSSDSLWSLIDVGLLENSQSQKELISVNGVQSSDYYTYAGSTSGDNSQSPKEARENPYNEPAPLAACRTGNVKWLQEELAKDSSIVNNKYFCEDDDDHHVSLIQIASIEGHGEVVETLIKAGAEVNKACDGGNATPLLLASENGRLDVVSVLIRHDADVNTQCDSYTSLFHAIYSEHIDVAKFLINSGADVKAKFADGITSLHIASHCGFYDVVNMLIDKGADVNAEWQFKGSPITPLYLACQEGHIDVVSLLFNHFQLPEERHFTDCVRLLKMIELSLSVARSNGRSELVTFLENNIKLKLKM